MIVTFCVIIINYQSMFFPYVAEMGFQSLFFIIQCNKTKKIEEC